MNQHKHPSAVFAVVALLAILATCVAVTGCEALPDWARVAEPATAPAAAPVPAPKSPAAPPGTPPAAAPAPAAAAPTPPPILPFDTALATAAADLFNKAQQAVGADARRVIVIDPLIDGASAVQSVATRKMEEAIVDLVKRRYPQFDPQPFSRASLARTPLVLVGTFTAVNNAGKPERPDAYRICLALADLGSGRILSKGTARAHPQGLDTTPTAFFRDAPGWLRDPRSDGYIRTCQGTKPGEAIDPIYLDNILVASVIAQAIDLYGKRRYQDALQEYSGALQMAGGRQLRVLNGVYLSNLRLGRPAQAEAAFAELVDFGLGARKLGMMFVFRPGSTDLSSDPLAPTPYPMWLRQLAARALRANACLELTGHTSKTGPEPLNERLSLLRAETIRQRLEREAPPLRERMITTGVGSRETIIGTGADDLSDAFDRRVDFKVVGC
ncbi:MAG: OmpA family protein [Pseudomonadota bacterium]